MGGGAARWRRRTKDPAPNFRLLQPLLCKPVAMDSESGTPLLGSKPWNLRGTFAASLVGLTAALLALLAAFCEYAPDLSDAHVDRYYSYLTDVRFARILGAVWEMGGLGLIAPRQAILTSIFDRPAPPQPALPQVYVMVFLGFGCLMTFLRRYSLSAVALNYACSCLVLLEAVLAIGWAQQGWGARVQLDLPLLIDATFCAAAAMISFGAVLGKSTPAQLVWLLALEVPVYAANAQLVAGRWGALDVGGSMTIHAFGAVFGLAASVWLSPRGGGAGHPKNGASHASDLTAMLGTLFLFIYWCVCAH